MGIEHGAGPAIICRRARRRRFIAATHSVTVPERNTARPPDRHNKNRSEETPVFFNCCSRSSLFSSSGREAIVSGRGSGLIWPGRGDEEGGIKGGF
jgi:hypothetical protein